MLPSSQRWVGAYLLPVVRRNVPRGGEVWSSPLDSERGPRAGVTEPHSREPGSSTACYCTCERNELSPCFSHCCVWLSVFCALSSILTNKFDKLGLFKIKELSTWRNHTKQKSKLKQQPGGHVTAHVFKMIVLIKVLPDKKKSAACRALAKSYDFTEKE